MEVSLLQAEQRQLTAFLCRLHPSGNLLDSVYAPQLLVALSDQKGQKEGESSKN